MRPFTTSRMLTAATLLTLAACADGSDLEAADDDPAAGDADTAAALGAGAAERHAPSLDGLWKTDGYGFAMEIRGDDVRMWQTTTVSCLPSYTGHRTTASPARNGAVGFALDVLDGQVMATIAPGATPDRKRMRTEGSVTDWGLVRIGALPPACDAPTASDPVATFDVLWTTFAENYPFNPAKGVDWNEVRTRLRPQVGTATTPEELFRILVDAVRPLHDMHTHIFSEVGGYDGWRPDTEPYTEELLAQVTRVVEERDVGAPLRSFAGGRVGFADLAGRLGYLRITSFDFGTGDADADAVEMDRIFDDIFTAERVARQRGLVIDVRASNGGHNTLGLLVAGRLTRRPYLAYTNVARRPTQGTYTRPEPSWVVPPRGRPVYSGPVVLLTSRYTVSAHEVFAQALMGRSPAVVRIGENTQGAISDHHFRALPNGWVFLLPNQRFFTGGAAYDGAGVPPTIRVPTITADELARGEDAAFDRAVAFLATGR
jgi:hypothetical protein